MVEPLPWLSFDSNSGPHSDSGTVGTTAIDHFQRVCSLWNLMPEARFKTSLDGDGDATGTSLSHRANLQSRVEVRRCDQNVGKTGACG